MTSLADLIEEFRTEYPDEWDEAEEWAASISIDGKLAVFINIDEIEDK